MTHLIDVTWQGSAIAVITFSDARRQNQLCWAAVDELGATLQSCRENGAKVVVVASGLAQHWLEHAWLKDLLNGLEGREQTGSGEGWFLAQQELAHREMISIAAISGNCSGGGAEIGWACDLRIVEEQAQFCQPEINMGLTTGIGGTSRLSRLVGRTTATEMVLTGQPQTAARLYELGAITRVVPAGQALACSLDIATDIAAKSAEALAGFKQILTGNDKELEEELRAEQVIFQTVALSDGAKDAIRRVQVVYEEGSTEPGELGSLAKMTL